MKSTIESLASGVSVFAGPLVDSGQLINLFPDWPDERFPLYACDPSRRNLPAKSRRFLDLVASLVSGAGDVQAPAGPFSRPRKQLA